MAETKNERDETDRLDKVLGLDDIRSDVVEGWGNAPFADGFSWKVVLAAVFIALFMLPGLIYMGLAVGASIGSGAEWVTVLLFLELARRSYQKLRRQELFMILYMAQSLVAMMGGVMLSGGVFAFLIWQQYLKCSTAFRTFNLTDQAPAWFAPSIEVLKDRTFITSAWLPAIMVAFLGMLFFRMQYFGIGYLVFRVTSDVEKLPFPLARVGAEGATALAESDAGGRESWRWSVFSVMAIVGAVWGGLYMGVPSLSSVLFGTRTALIPIPFLDLTPYTEGVLPSAALAVGFDLALVLLAFVIPWRVIVGMAVSCLASQIVLPPILRHYGVHRSWQPGYGALDTQIANGLDLWMSVGIGAALSLALTGVWMSISMSRRAKQAGGKKTYDWKALFHPPEGRGDFPLWFALTMFFGAGSALLFLCHGVVNLGWFGGFPKPPAERFPLWMLACFAFLWTPLSTYINARMAGIAGQSVSLPYLREGAFILSGYRHPDIWLAPIPLNDYGFVATIYKQLEMIRVRFTSLLKVEALALVALTLAGFFYWSYIWKLGPIPGDSYPFAQQMWPFMAKNAALWASALGEGNNQMLSALKPNIIVGSIGVFTALFAAMSVGGIPLAYYFGAVAGVGQFPYVVMTMLFGLGLRMYVSRKLGSERLKRYAPVMMAGFAAGFGIAGMLIVGVVLIKSAISGMPY